MLGIGNIVTAGSKVANVVRKGLQAWYKADQTQAPLSEEKIHNPNFSLGPNVDLLNHNNWYRNTTTPSSSQLADGDDFIFPGNSDIPFTSPQTGITLTEHGFRFKTSGTSTFIAMGQNNVMNSASANEETLMLTYDILQNNGGGVLYIAMASNDQALDITVGSHVFYFTPTTSNFQIKRGGDDLDVTIANIRLVKTNPTIRGNKWAVSKLASQDMACSFDDDSDLINHPANTNIKVGMKVQGSGIPSSSVITAVNVNGSNTQFRINKNSTSPKTNTALRIRAASTVHVEDRAVSIDYNSTDLNNTSVSLGNKIKLNQKYQVEVVVDELSVDKKLKIQTGDDANNLSLGVNTFEMMSTNGTTISLARSFDSTSVTAKVSKVSLKEITNSVKDFSNNPNDAILYSGKALHFNGTDDRINLGTASDLVGHENFTVALWVKTNMTASQNDVRIFSANVSASSTYFSIGLDSTKRFQMYLRFTNQDGSSVLFGSNGTTANGGTALVQDVAVNDNQWRRVVVSSTKYITRFYINGELIKIFDITKNSDYTGSAFLGSGPSATSNDLTGDIADFQVYNKAWTPDDVTFDYNNPDKDVFDDEGRAQVLGNEKSPAINNTNWETNSVHWPAGYNPISDNGIITWDGNQTGFAGVQPKDAYYDRTVIGRYYLVTFDATRTAGTLQFKATGDVGAGAGVNVTSSSTFSSVIQADGIGWYFTATSDFVGTISNISLKEVIVHAGEISPTSCLKLLRLNEGSGLRLYDAAPVLGEELNTFANPTSVTNESVNIPTSTDGTTGFSSSHITADSSVFSNGSHSIKFQAVSNGNRSFLDLDSILTAGKLYLLKVDVRHLGSGDDFILQFNNLSTLNATGTGSSIRTTLATITSSNTAFTTYTKFFTHNANTKYFGVKENGSNNNAAGYIDNLTIKEIKPSTSYFYADGDHNSNEWIDEQPYIPQYAMSSFSKKLFFDGASRVHGTSSLSVPNNFTASVWYTPDGTGTSSSDRRTIFGFAKASGDFTFRTFEISHWEDGGDNFDGQHDDLFVWSGNGDTSASQTDTNQSLPNGGYVSKRIESNYSSNPSKLTHIAVSVSDGVYKAYVNGILKETFTPGWYNTSLSASQNYSVIDNFIIGARRNNSQSSPAKGIVDEVSLFSKVLTHDEINEIFNAGTALDIRNHSCYYGSEVITNGDFTAAGTLGDSSYSLGWAKNNAGSDVSIANGELILFNSTGSANDGRIYATNSSAENFNVVTSGKFYKLTYTITEVSGGTPDLEYHTGGSYVSFTAAQQAVGTHTKVYQATGSIFLLRQIAAGVTVKVSNVSLKEVQTLGYWRNNGSETWTDLSPYGNNGTIAGTPQAIQLQEVPLFKKDSLSLPMNKVRQRGFNLDGFGYAKVDDNNTLGTMGGGFTCAFWYRHAENIDTNNYYYLVNKGTSLGTGANNGFGTAVYDNKIYFDFNTSVQRYSLQHTIGAASSSNPVWYYITATYNGSNECVLYVNAEAKTTISNVSGSISATAEAHPITIGTNYAYNSAMARTVLDEVKWYNRALSFSEIKRNFKSSKSKHSSTSNWSDDFSDSFI